MGNPGAVVAGLDLAELVQADLLHRRVVGLGVALDRDLGRHAAHRRDTATVAGLDEQADVGICDGQTTPNARCGPMKGTVIVTALRSGRTMLDL